MSDKKDIDRLFQEKFRDFAPIPDGYLWDKIESDLNTKEGKSRKIIPIWWRLGGIAAAIALLLTLGYNYTSIFTNTDSQLPEKEIITDLEDSQNIKDSQINIEENNVKITNTDNDEEGAKINAKTQSQNNYKVVTSKDAIIKNTAPITSSIKNRKSDVNNKSTLVLDYKKNTVKKDISPDIVTSEKTKVVSVDPKINQKNKDTDLKKKEHLFIEKETQETIASVTSEEKKAEKEKQSIFDVIKEKETLTDNTITEKINRWSLRPNVAPIYFSSITNGSPIGSQFESNTKTGNVNISYGVNVSYKVSKRLSVRSGLNKVNYGYNTNDITVTTASAQTTQAVSTINFNDNVSNIAINATPNIARLQSQTQNLDVISLSTTPEIDGVLTQEFGYLEVPLELEYRLVDKKLGVNLIGGISSLFLTDNSISVDAENFATEIGEANNLNSTNFSTNIGIGVNYKISEKVQINVEPVFKYQLNTFSSDAGGFRPYSLGIYSGFSITF